MPHSSLAVRLVLWPTVPGGQKVPVAEPRAQYDPTVHGSGVCVAPGQNLPGGQGPTQSGLSCFKISSSEP